MPKTKMSQLIDVLVKQGIIDRQKKEVLEIEVQKTQKSEEEVLLASHILDEDALFALKGKLLRRPVVKPDIQEVPLDVLEIISEEATVNYSMIPLFRRNNAVGIGMVYPENMLAQNALRFLSRKENFTYQIYVISFTDFKRVLQRYHQLKNEAQKVLAGIHGQSPGEVVKSNKEEAPVAKIVTVILQNALEGNASDIHIEPTRENLHVRFRQDGILYLSLLLPMSVHAAVVSHLKIMAGLAINGPESLQQGRFSIQVQNRQVDFRIDTFPTLQGEKIHVRVMDGISGLKGFARLGFSRRDFELIRSVLRKRRGLVLVAGLTGSGVTTTLYAMVRALANTALNVCTIEHPVEYVLEGVNQVQVAPEKGLGFEVALSQAAFEDADVLMLSDIGDAKTALSACKAAASGRLVIAGMRSQGAIDAILQLTSMGVPGMLVASSLELAVGQRLVRVLCDACKKQVVLRESMRKYMAGVLKALPLEHREAVDIKQAVFLFEGNGCQECNFKGYKGRTGLYEVLSLDEGVADILISGQGSAAFKKAAYKQGVVTLEQGGVLKVLAGHTSLEEIQSVI